MNNKLKNDVPDNKRKRNAGFIGLGVIILVIAWGIYTYINYIVAIIVLIVSIIGIVYWFNQLED